MASHKDRIIKIQEQWYIETRTGYDGPFKFEQEAKKYLNLLKSCDAARSEFAGLQFSTN